MQNNLQFAKKKEIRQRTCDKDNGNSIRADEVNEFIISLKF